MGDEAAGIPWVVCDFETTGIHPAYHHRVVEIGLVYGKGREIQGEWTTTVNPQRDVTASAVHGLRGGDVVDSPTFNQIAGSVLEVFNGRVPIAHNASFDKGFLDSELDHSGIPDHPPDWFCTLRALASLGFHPTNLEACCAACGISLGEAHTALADAKACAELVALEYEQFAPAMAELRPFSFDGSIKASASPRPRGASAELPKRTLTDIGLALPKESAVEQAAVQAYTQLLVRVLEDRRVTDDEHAALLTCAQELELPREAVESIHGSYLAALNAKFLSDGFLSDSERRDLQAVEALLGLVRSQPMRSLRRRSLRSQSPSSGQPCASPGNLNQRLTDRPSRGRAHKAWLRAQDWSTNPA